ncbi:MAG: U-box protein 15-like [Gammaproteobacteria bacterium]|jgi:hypothetical protein|nr:U-box protein 15-like [Gammaproteobacteria bacterium]
MAAIEKDMKKGPSEKITIGRSVSYSSWLQFCAPPHHNNRFGPTPNKPDLAYCWSPKGVLEDYRKNREERGNEQDLPDDKFPGHILEEASLCSWSAEVTQSSTGCSWLLRNGGYWWKTSYKDGSTRCEFYWKPDVARGYPDKTTREGRYWFIICHAPTQTEIEGFCFEPDVERGFPLRSMSDDTYSNGSFRSQYCSKETYHFFITYTECGTIKEWEEKRDAKILAHLDQKKKEIEMLNQKKIEEASRFYFSKPWKLSERSLVKKPLVNIPHDYRCPLSLQIIFDPVVATDGHTYEREEIERWFRNSSISPRTGQILYDKTLFPNFHARSVIDSFLAKFPDAWKEVYISSCLRDELFQLLSGHQAVDIKKWRSIIEKDRRLLAFPIGEEKILLLSFLCKQSEAIVKSYLPEVISMFTSTEWKAIATIGSIQDWIMLIAKTCDTFSMLSLAEHFFKALQQETDIKIDPVDMGLYAIENRNISLFKLALSQVSNINQALEKGNTFLHIVAYKGESDFVRVLLEKGASIKQKNHAGLKPAALAKEAGYEGISDQIEFYKIAPLLQRVGIFSRIEKLEKTNHVLEVRLSKLEEMVAQRTISAAARQIEFMNGSVNSQASAGNNDLKCEDEKRTDSWFCRK